MDEHIQTSLRLRFESYEPVGVHLGTYGLVWVMSASQANMVPSSFALKTVNVNRRSKHITPAEMERLFRRELRLWLSLPVHRNVLPILGIEVLPVPSDTDAQAVNIPMARMPSCDGTLQEWIDSGPPAPDRVADRLAAI